MAISPASGALSQTQLAVLEQIRTMRAAKPAAPVQAKPAAAEAAPTQPLATAVATASPMPGNRPRGSILNITV